MENIAHCLCGAAIAEAGFSERVGRKASWWVAIVSANLPDIDLATYVWPGRDYYLLWHRGFTHSLTACVLFPPLIALAAHLLTRRKYSFLLLWLLAFLGFASHLAMDVVTSWGTMLLMPFSDVRVSTHWVYIVDIFFWVILSMPFWLGRIVPMERRRVARFSLALVAAYVGLCGVFHELAVRDVYAAADRQGIRVEAVEVYPSPFLPVYWNGVATGEHHLYQGRIQSVGGSEPVLGAVYHRNFEHPAVQAAVETEYGRRFADWWATSPFAVVRCKDDRRWVLLRDLRYNNPWIDRQSFSLAFEVVADPNGRTYEVVDHFWVTPWTGEVVPEASCDLLPRARSPRGAENR